MFTVCPKCALTLVVTAGDLRIGQGYVRCGRCSNVFNALVGLSEERQAAVTGTPAATPEAETREPSPPASGLALESADDNEVDVPDSALEFDADVAQVFVEPRPGPHDASSGTFETIVLEANDLIATDADAANDTEVADTQAANDASLDDAASAGFDRSRVERPRVRVEKPPPEPDVATPTAEASTSDAVAESLAANEGLARSRSRLAAWSGGIAGLVVLLAVQIVHHNRHELAVDARFRGPLSVLYEAIGVPLVPRWNLDVYDVRQLGASAEGGARGVLTVRASVQNSGENPQPLPLLRVTVQDRFGNRIAARDVAASAYAARAAAISEYLEVGERVDAEIRLADPGPNAVGFELDACLPVEEGRIACANARRAR